ncbi:YciI family protein [Parafrigoribacterium humi]|uniref:YciI family protein n=1 Tax=Parafrigoribacterium humi TaxID=3144664 RepID=UPI0032EB76FD
MQYLFFIGTAPDSAIEPSDGPEESETPDNWVEEMDGRGVRKFGDRLRPAEDATTVRVRDGELLVTDGPFVEGKEYIAGIDVIECADLDEAIEIASKHPMARYGLVEIRPFWPFE